MQFSKETTAFIYPGQASQYVGMGSDLYEKYDSVKNVYSTASDLLGFDLAELSFNGPIEKLTQTFVTQPAIFTHSYALTMLLRENGYKPGYSAGHSLGEYSALVAAESIDFIDALKVVKVRANAMQKACEENPGTMAAIIGMDLVSLEGLCSKVGNGGSVRVANLNSPSQLVISGTHDAVHEVMTAAKENGAKIVKELNVSGAFHSSLMESAVEELDESLRRMNISVPSFPVYTNFTALPLSDPDEIMNSLSKQITNPVKWYPTILNMAAEGVTNFIEVGPGKVLQGLIKRIDKNLSASGFDTLDDLNGALN